MNKPEAFSILKEIKDLEDVPDDQLQWLIDMGEIQSFEPDDPVFKPGDPIDTMFIILEGSVSLKAMQGNQYRNIGTLGKHEITGLLPYSRAREARGYSVTLEPTTLLTLARPHFREMITQHEALTTALVHKMSTRIREFTKTEQQNDKMMALGKLAAGLAHELNNPSAAIIRSAQALGKRLSQVPDQFKEINKVQLTESQVDLLNNLITAKLDKKQSPVGMLERSGREDELLEWLEEHKVEDADLLAESLVEYGFLTKDLQELSSIVSEEKLYDVLNWIDQMLGTERLVQEIEEASRRINTLVTSVKGYTHMDQAPEKRDVDIHEGIESTLTMLNHKIHKQGITVHREYQENLEKPSILISEMNQVWTNLIDNAIDAMEGAEQKILTIRTSQDNANLNVTIQDSGSGIPVDIQGKIYDPFFTTKSIGKGTGLGLEVVMQIIKNQHNGNLTFETSPGKTEFKVCIPIKDA